MTRPLLQGVGAVEEKKIALFVIYSPQFRVVRKIFSIQADGRVITAIFQQAKKEFCQYSQKGDELRFIGLLDNEFSVGILPVEVEGFNILGKKREEE